MPRNPFRRRRRPPDTSRDSVEFLTGDPEEDRRSIRLLLDAMVEVGSGLGLDDLLDRLVDKAVEVARSERGLLLLAERGGLEVRVARDGSGRSLPKTVPFSTTVASRVFADGVPLATVVQSDREARELGRSVYDLKLRAVMCAPLEAGGRRLGVIYVDSQAETRAFDRRALAFFAALARQIAVSLENARLLNASLAKAKLEKELELARRIQEHLLPAPGGLPADLSCAHWFRPAGAASGDTFDVAASGDGSVWLFLGDVSGHGVGPALIAHSVQAALRSYLEVLDDLSGVLARLDRRLSAGIEAGTFLSLFLAHLSPPTDGERTLTFVNAGHGGVFVARQGSVQRLPVTTPALGLGAAGSFAPAPAEAFPPGSLLFLCSDGLLEARNPQRDLFGEARLTELLRERSTAGAEAAVAAVVGALEAHTAGAELEDDVMLLAVSSNPAP